MEGDIADGFQAGAFFAPLPARLADRLPMPPLADAERTRTLTDTVTQIAKKWGSGTIVRLGDVRRTRTAREGAVTRSPNIPEWWPSLDSGRPRMVEFIADPGHGGLSLVLGWMGAAKPLLAAFIDPLCQLYPPAAAAAGVDLRSLMIVRPPAATSRLIIDAAMILLRAEAFDVIACHFPPGARMSLAQANHLNVLASRSDTSLLVLSRPHRVHKGGILGSAAEYRIRLAGRKWTMEHGQLVGATFEVRTERAKGAMDGIDDVRHSIRFGLHNPYESGELVAGVPAYKPHESALITPKHQQQAGAISGELKRLHGA
jgi:hypothetical protein